jgi:hypothetical protein
MSRPAYQLLAVSVALGAAAACAQPRRRGPQQVVVEIPTCPTDTLASVPNSVAWRRAAGVEMRLSPEVGALVVEFATTESAPPRVDGVRVWLRGRGTSRDTIVAAHAVRLDSLPAGRHWLRVGRLGYRVWSDSVDVRPKYVDTVRVTQVPSVVCLQGARAD